MKNEYFSSLFPQKSHFLPQEVKTLKKFIKYLQKFSQSYVRYQHIVQFDQTIWKLDCFEKKCPQKAAQPAIVLGSRPTF